MVIMDSSYDGVQLEGLPPSYLKNGNIHYQTPMEIKTTNIVNGVQNIGSSISSGIQSIPPQVLMIKDRIVNRNYFLFEEDNNYRNGNIHHQNDTEQPTFISYKDSQNLFKPIGIKNNESCFEYSEKPRFRSFSSPTQLELELDSKSQIISLPSCFNNISDEETLKRIRSMSISSIEKVKQIEIEKGINNEEFDIDDVIYYVDYQERLEREELERIDKNNCILSQNSKESYSCLEIYNTSPIYYSSSGNSPSTVLSPRPFSTSSPTNSTYSLSLPSTPSKSQSPIPTPSQSISNITFNNNNNYNIQDCSSKSFPVLKRSISATLPKLTKSSSKISISPLTIKEEVIEVPPPPTTIKNQFLQINLQKSPSASSMNLSSSSRDLCKSPTPVNKSNLSSSTTSLPTLSSSTNSMPTGHSKSKGILKSHLVKCASNNNIPSGSPKSPSPITKSVKLKSCPAIELQESFQNELKHHLKLKKDNFKDKLEKYDSLRKSLKEPKEPTLETNNRLKISFILPTKNSKISRYFLTTDKIQVIKDYIEYLSIMETNLFGCKFQNSEYNYQILDCDFTFTIQPTKIKIQNFNVTFKDAGFNEDSQSIININITSKNIELK